MRPYCGIIAAGKRIDFCERSISQLTRRLRCENRFSHLRVTGSPCRDTVGTVESELPVPLGFSGPEARFVGVVRSGASRFILRRNANERARRAVGDRQFQGGHLACGSTIAPREASIPRANSNQAEFAIQAGSDPPPPHRLGGREHRPRVRIFRQRL